MTDYTELVEALRCELHYTSCPETNCKYICHDTFCDTYRLMVDAAAAIEELDAEETRLLLITSELQDKVVELEEELNDADVAADDNARQIEELQAEVAELKRTDSKRCQECLYLGQPVGEQLIQKRGKWIIDGAYTYNLMELNGKAYEPVYRCSCCNRQMESYLRLDEPKMPEDADFPEYCPHCGARMEVQDDKV